MQKDVPRVGTSEGKCDEGHPQLPEPHHPCCEKQMELPPRMHAGDQVCGLDRDPQSVCSMSPKPVAALSQRWEQ